MKKQELAQNAAHGKGVTPETAADEMDSAINLLLRTLRRGEIAHLPGLGKIAPGRRWVFRQEKSGER